MTDVEQRKAGLTHPFPPGTVVRNYSDQFSKAYRLGTATVVRSFRRGQWLEYEVEYHKDNPMRQLLGRDRSEWSSESTFAIDAQPDVEPDTSEDSPTDRP